MQGDPEVIALLTEQLTSELARLRRMIEFDRQLDAIRAGDYVEYAPTT